MNNINQIIKMKKIFISPELKTILKNIVETNSDDKTVISKALLKVGEDGVSEDAANKDYYNYFTISTESKKYISFVKKDKLTEKIVKYNDDLTKKSQVTNDMLQDFDEKFFTRKVARVRAKPGKFISRVFKKEYIEENFRARDIEYFSNQYAASVRDKVDIRLVKGNDIKKYYLQDNYEEDCPPGTLRGSCMGPRNRQDFMNFYANNDNVSMLVSFSENNKVTARAIVWDNVKFYKGDKLVDEGSFMDRVYYTDDWLEQKFKNWAKEEGCYSKFRQSHDSQTSFITPDAKQRDFKIEIPLDLRSEYFPYMDTLCFPNYEKGVLSNVVYKGNYSELRAHATGKPSMVYDFISEKIINLNSSKWSKCENTYIHLDDIIEVGGENFHKESCEKDRMGGYITPNDEKVKCVFTGDEFAKREMVESKYHDGLIHKKESVESIDAGLIHKDDSVKSKYLNKILSKKGSIKLERVDDYFPKDIIESGVDLNQLEKVIESLKSIQGEKEEDDDGSTFIFEF